MFAPPICRRSTPGIEAANPTTPLMIVSLALAAMSALMSRMIDPKPGVAAPFDVGPDPSVSPADFRVTTFASGLSFNSIVNGTEPESLGFEVSLSPGKYFLVVVNREPTYSSPVLRPNSRPSWSRKPPASWAACCAWWAWRRRAAS